MNCFAVELWWSNKKNLMDRTTDSTQNEPQSENDRRAREWKSRAVRRPFRDDRTDGDKNHGAQIQIEDLGRKIKGRFLLKMEWIFRTGINYEKIEKWK